MRTFLPKFAIKKYSTYVAMIVIFVHNYVLDEDLNCTCDAEGSCNRYMFLPFLILFALQLWRDELFKGVWKYSWSTCTSYKCCKKKCSCCYCSCGWKYFLVFCFHIMKAVCIGLLWVLSVLIDGDWFVCCWNTYEEHPQLGCKDKEKITAEEQVLIAKLKNKSMIIGLGILSAGFLVVSLLLPCGWKKCCEKIKKCQICCDKKLLYDQMILEEEENVLTEVIRKAAKDNLTEEIKKLGNETWGECFDVAETLIEKNGEKKTSAGHKDNIPLENKGPEGDKLMEESDSEKRTTKVKEAVRVKYREQQKYISSEGQLTYTSFLECVAKKFNIPNVDLKVLDDSKTEVDEDVFDFLMKKQNLGMLEICQAQGPNPDDSSASTSFTSSSGKNKVDSDDTTLLEHSRTKRQRADDTSLARGAQPLIETVSEKTSAK